MNSLLRRRVLIGQQEHYDWDSYIQDGLIFQLDGLNKGSNLGTWTDLVGGIVFENVGDVQELSDGWQFGDGKYFHSDSYLGPLLSGSIANASIEIVYSGDPDNACMFGDKSFVFRYYLSSNIWILTSCQSARVTLRANIIQKIPYNRLSLVVKKTGASQSFLIQNGSKYIPSAADFWTGYGQETFIGSENRTLSPASCVIHAIRVYNKALTEEEVLYNQKIDKQRFKIS